MQKGYILVLDSGVGGLSVLKELVKRVRGQRFLYLGDNFNAPYGSKRKDELLSLVKNNIKFASRYKIKAIVLACNTLSVSLYNEICEFAKLPVFGIFPPKIKKEENSVILATPLTCKCFDESTYNVYPLYDLARDIEDNLFALNNVKLDKHLMGIKEKFDVVILGCTHYEFLKNEIFDHLKPQKILSGINLCVDQVCKYCANKETSVKSKRNRILFIGETAKINRRFFYKVVNML